MTKVRTWAAAAVLVALAACTTPEEPQVETASRERMVETSAVVEAVAAERRELMLRAADGRLFTVTAGPEVRNFDQIDVGDQVQVVLFESVVASMASADQAAQEDAVVAVERAPEGARPGVAVASEVQTTVDFVSFDPVTDVATFTTPDGLSHSVVVDPAMRDFALRRQPGDRINLTLTDAIAATIVETGS